jgi:hypothetical protein
MEHEEPNHYQKQGNTKKADKEDKRCFEERTEKVLPVTRGGLRSQHGRPTTWPRSVCQRCPAISTKPILFLIGVTALSTIFHQTLSMHRGK